MSGRQYVICILIIIFRNGYGDRAYKSVMNLLAMGKTQEGWILKLVKIQVCSALKVKENMRTRSSPSMICFITAVFKQPVGRGGRDSPRETRALPFK